MKKKPNFDKNFSKLLILTLFAAQSVIPSGYGGVAEAREPAPQNLSSMQIDIPASLGNLEDRVSGASGKTVIYIQDAHDSLEAQQNIAEILRHLVENHGVKTVFEEGYEGAVPTERLFGFIDNPEEKRRVSDFLLSKLRLGAAEYAHINRTKDFKLVGADHLEKYRKNVEAFRRTVEKREAVNQDLDAILTPVKSLANSRFPKPLREWLKIRERYETGQMQLMDYLKRAVDTLPQPAPDLEKMIPSILFVVNLQTRQEDFAVKRLQEIDARKLIEEIEALEQAIAVSYLSGEEDLRIFRYWEVLHLLKRLNRMEVTPPEYAVLKKNLKNLDTHKLAEFIALESKQSLALSKAWEEDILTAMRFYELANERDEAVEKALSVFLRNSDEKVTVLVYGGFHKENLKRIFKSLGISYQVVSPVISGPDPVRQNYYQQLMANGFHDYEKQFLTSSGIAPFAARPPSFFIESFGEISVREIHRIVSLNPGTPVELLDKKIALGTYGRPELRMISPYTLTEAFGEIGNGPVLSGGRNEDFLYEEGKKIAVIMPWSKFIYRALDADGKEVPNRIYKITHYASENEVLFREAQKIFKLQQAPEKLNTPAISRMGMMKSGGLWMELEGIASARSLDREVFGRTRRLLDVLIRAADSLKKIHEHGVIHGDVKPGNLLINNQQEIEWIDFGGNYTRAYVALDENRTPIEENLSADTDVYSFIMMTAQLLDYRSRSVSPEQSQTLREMKESYLRLILKKWSFGFFDELLRFGPWTDKLTPLPRKSWPASMGVVVEKLKEDLDRFQKLYPNDSASEARGELRDDLTDPLMEAPFFEDDRTDEKLEVIVRRLVQKVYKSTGKFPDLTYNISDIEDPSGALREKDQIVILKIKQEPVQPETQKIVSGIDVVVSYSAFGSDKFGRKSYIGRIQSWQTDISGRTFYKNYRSPNIISEWEGPSAEKDAVSMAELIWMNISGNPLWQTIANSRAELRSEDFLPPLEKLSSDIEGTFIPLESLYTARDAGYDFELRVPLRGSPGGLSDADFALLDAEDLEALTETQMWDYYIFDFDEAGNLFIRLDSDDVIPDEVPQVWVFSKEEMKLGNGILLFDPRIYAANRDAIEKVKQEILELEIPEAGSFERVQNRERMEKLEDRLEELQGAVFYLRFENFGKTGDGFFISRAMPEDKRGPFLLDYISRSELRSSGRDAYSLSMRNIENMDPLETVQNVRRMATREDIFDKHASFFIDLIHPETAAVNIGYGVHANLLDRADDSGLMLDARALFFRIHYRPEREVGGRKIPEFIVIKPPYLLEEKFAHSRDLVLPEELEEGLYADIINLSEFLLKGGFPENLKVIFHEFDGSPRITHGLSQVSNRENFDPSQPEISLGQLSRLSRELGSLKASSAPPLEITGEFRRVEHPGLFQLTGVDTAVVFKGVFPFPEEAKEEDIENNLDLSVRFARYGVKDVFRRSQTKWGAEKQLSILGIGGGAGIDAMSAVYQALTVQRAARLEMDLIEIHDNALENMAFNIYAQLQALGIEFSYSESEKVFELGERGVIRLHRVTPGQEFEPLLNSGKKFDLVFFNAPEVILNSLDPDNANLLEMRESDFSGMLDSIPEVLSQEGEVVIETTPLGHRSAIEMARKNLLIIKPEAALDSFAGSRVLMSLTRSELRLAEAPREALGQAAFSGVSKAQGNLLLDADRFLSLTETQKDELFSRLYIHRENLKLVIYNARGQIPQGDRALNAIMRLNNVRLAREISYEAVIQKYSAAHHVNILFLVPEEVFQPSTSRVLKAVLLKNQPGEFEFARLLAANGGFLPAVPEQNGVFDPPASFLTGLHQRIMAALVVAYSA